ncbi:pectate lyase [Rheinheimera riviphila]|uniref:Pectate lyase n=1 Tax=Rheinheimera riviphila TaxID=1834037 RepID=A0A437QFE0_9GAMM|nr:pectate lyase [Rheinheimera riviphila]RVU33278.1 pectate lyase [Rheinheimera riviphila]
MFKKICGRSRDFFALALLLFLPVCTSAIAIDPEQDQGFDWRQQVAQDPAWQAYFARSEAFAAKDQALLQNELVLLQQTKASKPAKHKQFGFEPEPTVEYLQSPDAIRVAQVMLSFQTPSGGWSKRTDMAGLPRQPGQMFGVEKNYIPTFDNGATTTQLRWLAAFYPYAPAALQPKLKAALEKGVQFVLAAQYPNGGFAQTYPLRGGYHDAVTLNDHVLVELLRLLKDVAAAPQFALLPEHIRQQAKQQFVLGTELLLKAQVKLNGKLTIWAAQHHPLTLEPLAARAYELAALASSESAGVTLLLMELPQPSAAVVQAVEAAVSWFSEKQILDTKVERDDKGMRLVAAPGAKPLWARFYDLKTQQPLFVDRDGSIKAKVTELSLERQQGYGWYQNNAAAVLKAYPKWRAKL